MLQLIRSDELAAPPLARYQALRALVLLVDLLPVPPASNDSVATHGRGSLTRRRCSDDHEDGVEASRRRHLHQVEVRKSSETDAESARFLERHLLVGDLEPLLLPHPTPTSQ